MDGTIRKCTFCREFDSKRRCNDCLFPNNEFCEKCFKERHSGISSQHHLSRDIKYNAIIIENPSTAGSYTENSQFHSIDLPSTEMTDYSTSFSSSRSDPCILFENGSIKSFDSVDELAQALFIDKSIEKINFQIISFISQPINNEPLPNLLLLSDNEIKFTPGRNLTKNPLCIMIYDTKNKLIILETQDIQEENSKIVDNQIKLINFILALSDVIVFYENKRRKDYIRMHKMMKICKDRHNFHFQKIHKNEPEKLAPALIYLQLKKEFLNDDLSTCIKDATDRSDLFASFTKIININDLNNNQEFFDGLTNILENISQHRNYHSLEDLMLCISNCKESLNENIPIFDIPNEWFLCHSSCELCNKFCRNCYGHSGLHSNEEDCISTLENAIYFCKKCKDSPNGKRISPLVFKPMSKNEGFFKNIIFYPIRREIVECEEHGIILDKNPLFPYYEDTVYTKHLHKWSGENLPTQNVYPVGQILIDKVNEMSRPMAKLVTESTEFVSDIIKPDNWQPVRGTSNCACCTNSFTGRMLKHHCRICKSVICSSCCVANQASPICNKCYTDNIDRNIQEEPRGIIFLNYIRDIYTCSSSYVKKNVAYFNRPGYWVDDESVRNCFLCLKEFNNEYNPIHHCRACGKCVCDQCSQNQRSVEWRYISDPTRVCDQCIKVQFWKSPDSELH